MSESKPVEARATPIDFLSETGALFDRRDLGVSALLLPFIAFVGFFLANVPPNAPEFAVFGWLLLAYFLYLLLGRFVVKRFMLRNSLVTVLPEQVCVRGGAFHTRTECRGYGPDIPVQVDYIRNGVANVFIGSPPFGVRLWAGAAVLYRVPGQRNALVCPAIASVDEFLTAIGLGSRQVKTTRWLGARVRPNA